MKLINLNILLRVNLNERRYVSTIFGTLETKYNRQRKMLCIRKKVTCTVKNSMTYNCGQA